jgi:uncharacterized protein
MEHTRDKAIRDITNKAEIEDVIKRSRFCHVGMVDGDEPYVLGFNFGYQDKYLYLHCSKTGHKLDVLARNNKICAAFDVDHDFFSRNEDVACSWRMRYRSILMWGSAEFVEDYNAKVDALKIIMSHYSDLDFEFNAPAVNNVTIIRVKISRISGRKFEIL